MLSSREKFNAVLGFEPSAPNLKIEFGFWAETIRNWLVNGLPKIDDVPDHLGGEALIRASSPLRPDSGEFVDRNVVSYFGLDSGLAKFPFDISPRLEKQVLEDSETHQLFKDEFGITQKILKQGACARLVVDVPVKDRRDFCHYKSLYDQDYAKRLPEDWEDLTRILRERTYPLRLGGAPFGFSFFARHLMGEVNFLTSLYDAPQLVNEINDFFLNFVMDYWSLILDQIDVDCVFILEDMAYRSGSLISADMFREFLSPYYIRFVDFLKQYGVTNIVVDCDGWIEKLIPLWLEVGVTGVFPVQAGNDIVGIQDRYPRLQLMGGIDKTVLINGTKKQIDEELEKIASVMKKPGFIPHVDHAVSPDVKWESFKYYREKLNRLIDHP